MAVSLINALRVEYNRLFETCEIKPTRQAAVETITNNILANKARYETAGTPLRLPWYFIGFVHSLESSLSFRKHLHNGDPLTARTIQVPAGRPVAGAPPFTREKSAADSLVFQRLDRVTDWSLAGTLFQLEKYNGFGYRSRTPAIPSPYLWSFASHYTKGKFVADGRFDENAVSRQCGAAALLRRMAERRDRCFRCGRQSGVRFRVCAGRRCRTPRDFLGDGCVRGGPPAPTPAEHVPKDIPASRRRSGA
jgi:lysozyme family protein